jgi:hypothetical protein
MRDANDYIRPDPKPYIDREKEEEQKLLWAQARKMIEDRNLPGLLKLMEGNGFTSEQRERAKALYYELYGEISVSAQNVQQGGRRR